MLKNYFKIAWRNLIKNKVSSFINIGGLAVGMAAAILIGLWIWDELSFNKYHQNYERIVQVMRNQIRNGEKETSVFHPMPLGNVLRRAYGNDFRYLVMARKTEEHVISSADKNFTLTGSYMQAEAPDMLTLKMVYGSRDGLNDKNSILIAESFAKTLFGNNNPINEVVKIDNLSEVKVTGVYADLPNNSEFKDVKFIAPFDLYISSSKTDQNDWGNYNTKIYVQLTPSVNPDKVSARIKHVLLHHVGKEIAERKPELFLHPMSKWHLYSKFENGISVTSDQLQFIWFYGIIGAFVLILACINFMNLSTARSEKRAKEVGIRKAIGSLRSQLIKQFFSESLLVVGFAFLAAIVMAQFGLRWFNEVAGKTINIPWSNPLFWLFGLLFTGFTSLVAGSYPALYLSSFNPVKVLKRTFRVGRLATIPRKTLVVIQFTISITLVIGTLIVYRQIQFAKNRPVGYSQDGLLMFRITTSDFKGKHDVLRTELKNTGVVIEASKSGSSVTGQSDQNKGFEWKGKDVTGEDPVFNLIAVTHEYGKTVGWNFVAGRDFSRQYHTDSSGIVINETAAKLLSLREPLNETVKGEVDFRGKMNFKIIGIVKDMITQSPFEPVKPSLFFLGNGPWIFIRIDPIVSFSQALPKIEAVFKKIAPAVPFSYQFASKDYATKFSEEERIGKLSSFFAVFAIFISCLGLFGLASFIAEQRTKEIGIRKVLGASVLSVWNLLSKDFVILVIISFLIAAPTSYYFMHNWLQNYQYRTELSGWIFIAAGLGAMVITLFTVSFQAIKAALANPIKSLRTE